MTYEVPTCPKCGTTNWIAYEEEMMLSETPLDAEQGRLDIDRMDRWGTGDAYMGDWKCENDHWLTDNTSAAVCGEKCSDDDEWIEDAKELLESASGWGL